MTREEKIFHASVAAMQGILANPEVNKKLWESDKLSLNDIMTDIAFDAVVASDCLLKEFNEFHGLDKEGGE